MNMEDLSDYQALEKKLGQLISSIKEEYPVDLAERIQIANQEMRERETDRRGKEDYYELRKRWSQYLFWFLLAMVAFQFLLTITIGLDLLSFQNYKHFLYIVVGENFLQIVGMCIIVVQFLFPKQK